MKLNQSLKKFLVSFLLAFIIFCIPQTIFAANRPGKIRNLKCKTTTSSSINISWTPQNNVSGYQVFRSSSYDGPFRKIKDIAPGNHAFCNLGLQNGREYYYRVRAYSGKRTGVFSNVLSTRTKCPSRTAFVRVSSNIRKHAGTNHPVITTLNSGTKVTVICVTNSKSGEIWNRISFKLNGKTKRGYIRNDLLTMQKQQKPTGIVIANSGLRLRKSDSIQSEIITTLPKGTSVTILKQTTGADKRKWYQVRVKRGKKTLTGYVFADYVRVS